MKSSTPLRVFDERLLSGSAGLFVSGVERGVFFDSFTIEAKKCCPISVISNERGREQDTGFSHPNSEDAARAVHLRTPSQLTQRYSSTVSPRNSSIKG